MGVGHHRFLRFVSSGIVVIRGSWFVIREGAPCGRSIYGDSGRADYTLKRKLEVKQLLNRGCRGYRESRGSREGAPLRGESIYGGGETVLAYGFCHLSWS